MPENEVTARNSLKAEGKLPIEISQTNMLNKDLNISFFKRCKT